MKDYKTWTKAKRRLNNNSPIPKGFHEREIWACSLGENIGSEEDFVVIKEQMREVLGF
jgi:hypothetical protein